MSDDLRPFGAESANLTGDERDLRALPVGNHVAEIVRVSRGATDNGSHIDLTVRNPSGELSDRIAYSTANGSRRVVALSHAAGIPVPTGDDLDGHGCLSDQFVGSLAGKAVGVVVRAGKDGVRIAGYVWPGMLLR
jgi:hypothetical protein